MSAQAWKNAFMSQSPSPRRPRGRKSLLAIISAVALVAVSSWVGVDLNSDDTPRDEAPSSFVATEGDFETCSVSTLPAEAEPVVEDILAGGPYEYPGEDGGHFGNFEGFLPDEHGNYYRSYTVDTPGLNHRGPQRIVVGGGSETDPEVWYYSDDHYESFCAIPDAED